jgi:energy-coupling factor transport system permease protein
MFLIDSLTTLLTISACLSLIILLSKILLGIIKWLLGLFIAGAPFLFAVFVISGYNIHGDWNTAFEWGSISFGLFFLKVKNLALLNIIIVKTSGAKDFISSLRSLGFPNKATIFITTLIRFIPQTFEEVKKIIDIQKCRGFNTKNLYNPKYFLPVFIPVFISQLNKANELSLTLEIRYFSFNNKKETSSGLKLKSVDMVLILLAVLFVFTGFSLV